MLAANSAVLQLMLLLLLPAALCSGAASSEEQHSCHPHFVYSAAAVAKNPKCNIPPANWGSLNAWCRDLAQNRPSPIELRLSSCVTAASVKPLRLSSSWGNDMQFSVKNNGHSVQATALSSDLTLSGGNLQQQFTVSQFHFHWGSAANMRNGVGSEHRLFDSSDKLVPTPAELHIVCRRSDLSFSQAAAAQDAIAVIGVFLQRGHSLKASAAVRKLIGDPSLVETPSSNGKTVQLKLRDLLPSNIQKFVNYDGAFTTPNCNPTVQWHIFTQPLRVKGRLLKKFTKTFFDSEKTEPMVDNFRPVMGLHGRELRCRR